MKKKVPFLGLVLALMTLVPSAHGGWHQGGCFNCSPPGGSTSSLRCEDAIEDGQTGETRCYDEESFIEVWDCFTEGSYCINVIATGGGGGGTGGGGGGSSSCTISGSGWCPATCFSCTRRLF